MSYSEVTISGYNSAPPVDDGSRGPTNQVKWATIKSKLFDPLRTALALIDDHVNSAIETADLTKASLESTVSAVSSGTTALATNLNAPSGTNMLFQQTTPPTGWTKWTDLDDYALRLVSGTADIGGDTPFSEVFTFRDFDEDYLPAHTHNFSDAGSTASFSGTKVFVYNIDSSGNDGQGGGSQTALTSISEDNDTVAGTWSFGVETAGQDVNGGDDWNFDIQYVDVIAATKS